MKLFILLAAAPLHVFFISVAESLAVEYERVIIFAADSILKDVAKNNHGASYP